MRFSKLIPWVVLAPQVILLPLYFFYPSWLLLLPGIIGAFLGTVLLLSNTLFFSIALLCLVTWVYNLLGNTPDSILIRSHMNSYFEKIRDNDAALTAFFSGMPKGADLHNHSSGAVYAEDFLQNAIDQQLYINLKTLELAPKPIDKSWQRIDRIKQNDSLVDLKQRLYQRWSMKDWYDSFEPADKHFFDAFRKFPPDKDLQMTRAGLFTLKRRAIAEHVSYLEIMKGGAGITNKDTSIDNALHNAMAAGNINEVNNILESLHNTYKPALVNSAKDYCQYMEDLHTGIDDSLFTMRFIATVRREAPPLTVFFDMLGGFLATQQDSLITGVNILNREDGEYAMKDYSLHMQMFHFLKKYYPNVHCSMHAGELTLGTVRPEDLTFHIREAVYTGGAERIGHGVDMAYEKDNDSLLQYMSQHHIAIEINLISNECILKVKDDAHPVMLYFDHQVPVTISTDDAGILRTSLTAQYVTLAKRYKKLTYTDIRQMVRNSITYSFLPAASKQRILLQLDHSFQEFEKHY